MVYDVIVLGAGGVGSAAAFHLARRGAKVLAIERFALGHDRGSSRGETRVIRQAYFEHPDYVPLLLRAYALWRELEAEVGVPLLRQVGLLQVGPAEGQVVRGVLTSASAHGLSVEKLERNEIAGRFPGFRLPPDAIGVFEPAAGYLFVERCVLAHLAAAANYGADVRSGIAVQSWRSHATGVTVECQTGERFTAAKLVIAAGPWANRLLGLESLPLAVLRKHVYWFPTSDAAYHQDRGCPTFLFELPQGVFYGFPQLDSAGVKVAEHSGGVPCDDPAADERSLDSADRQRVEAFLAEHLPGVGRPMSRHSVCYYTMSPDQHFVVGLHPSHDSVCFAAGLSGHGFKFTSVLGEALADLASTGRTQLPIRFLGLDRLNAEGRR